MKRIRSKNIIAYQLPIIQCTQEWKRGFSSSYLYEYTFKHGIAHLLLCKREKNAGQLLQNFDYLMRRLQILGSNGSYELLNDFIAGVYFSHHDKDQLGIWEKFMRMHVHFFARGTYHWGAEKILLQCAVEHGEDSPITKEADNWLSKGNGRWLWLRTLQRPLKHTSNSYVSIFEGHEAPVVGICCLNPQHFLSWSEDGTLRSWNIWTGRHIHTLQGHKKAIQGVLLLERMIVSWSDDGTIRLWDRHSFELIAVLDAHNGPVKEVRTYGDRKLLSYSSISDDRALSAGDTTLCLWDIHSGTLIHNFQGHKGAPTGVMNLSVNCFLSWSAAVIPDWDCGYLPVDSHLYLWDSESGGLQTRVDGGFDSVCGVRLVADRYLIYWGYRSSIYVWDIHTRTILHKLQGEINPSNRNAHIEVLPNGNVQFRDDKVSQVWEIHTGTLLQTNKITSPPKEPKTTSSRGTHLSLSNEYTLSCEGNIIRLKDNTYKQRAVPKDRLFEGVLQFDATKIIYWNRRNVFMWDTEAEKKL